jgi:hypothetical protein
MKCWIMPQGWVRMARRVKVVLGSNRGGRGVDVQRARVNVGGHGSCSRGWDGQARCHRELRIAMGPHYAD